MEDKDKIEEKEAAIIDIVSDGVYFLDLEGRITRVNKSVGRFGYKKEDLIGKPCTDFIAEKDIEKALRLIKTCIEKGNISNHEFNLKAKDGKENPALVSATLTRGVGGKPAGIVVIAKDITNLKKAEEILKESEEKYKTLVENMADSVCIVDLKGRALFANKAAEELTGYRLGEERGQSIRKLFPKKYWPLCLKKISQSTLGKPVPYFEIEIIDRSGKRIPVETGGQLIEFKGKKAIQIVTRDISERKNVAGALQQQAKDLNLMNEMVIELADASSVDDIHKLVCEGLKSITGALITTISIYNPRKQELRIEHISAESKLIDKAGRILGKRVKDLRTPLEPDIPEMMLSKRVEKLEGLHELTFGAIPKPVASVLEKSLGIGDVYALALHHKGELIGTMPIIMPKHSPPLSLEMLEAFSNLASTSIQRRKAEEELNRAYDDLEVKVQERTVELTKSTEKLHAEIAERKDTEEALRESEGKYRNIVELAPESIMTLDIKGVVTSCNPAFLKTTGFSKDEIIGKHFSKLPTLRARDIPEYAKVLSSILSGNIPKPFEFIWTHKDGTSRFGEAYFGLQKRGQRITGIQIILIDITERKGADEALRESEEKYRRMFELSPEGIVLLDGKGMLLDANEKAYDFTGYGPEYIIGKNVFELPFFTDETKAKIRENFAQRMAGKEIPPYEVEFINKRGEKRVVTIFATTIKDEEEKIIGELVIISDITERKRAEEELKIKNMAVESSISGIGITDLEGKLTYVNDSILKMWGYKDKSEILGKPLPEFWEGDRVFQTIKNLQEKGFDSGEDIGKRKDGSLFNLLFTANVIKDEKGEPTAMLGSFMDITERKGVEEALQESEERLVSFMESSPDAFGLLDSDLNYVEVNRKGLGMLGLTEEEIIGKNILEIAPGLEETGRYDKFLEVIKTGKPFFVDDIVPVRKSGDIHVALRAFKVGDGLGIITSDITERKRAEAAIQESEDKFKKLFEFAPDGYYLNDLKGNFVDGNKAGEELVGYKKEELIGKSFLKLKLLLPEQIPKAAKLLAKNALGKPTGPDEFTLNRKDGTQVPVEIRTFPVEIKGHKLVLGTARDVTERKQREGEILKLKEFSENIVENIPSPLAVFDKDLRIVSMNKRFCELHGKKKGELEGRSLYELHPEEEIKRNKIDEKLRHVLETGELMESRGVTRESPKGERILDIEFIPVKKAEEDMQVMVIANDITDRIRKTELQEKLDLLTKKKLKISENDKLILYSLTENPLATDDELSSKLNLPRTTITGIKNRLRDKEFYSTIAVPNFNALGCELLTIAYGKFSPSADEKEREKFIKEKIPEIVYSLATNSEFVFVSMARNLTDFERYVGSMLELYQQKNLIGDMGVIHIPFGLSKRTYLNFAPVLGNLLDLDFATEHGEFIWSKEAKRELGQNEKMVLYEFTKSPDSSSKDVAEITGLSRVTVNQIKKKLMDENLLRFVRIPNLEKIGCEILAACSENFRPEFSFDVRSKSMLSMNKNGHLFLGGETDLQSTHLCVFRNFTEYKDMYEKYVTEMKRKNFYARDPRIFIMPIQEVKYEMISFAPLAERILGLED